jgi:hypothetical protein
MPLKRITVLALHIIGKQTHHKKTYVGDPFVKTEPVFFLHNFTETHKTFYVQVIGAPELLRGIQAQFDRQIKR